MGCTIEAQAEGQVATPATAAEDDYREREVVQEAAAPTITTAHGAAEVEVLA